MEKWTESRFLFAIGKKEYEAANARVLHVQDATATEKVNCLFVEDVGISSTRGCSS